MHRSIADSTTVVVHFPGDRRWRPVEPTRDLTERITALDTPRDLLPLDEREPQLRTIPVTRLQASNGIYQSLHRLGCAAHCVGCLLERFAGRDAPADSSRSMRVNLRPFALLMTAKDLADRRAYTRPRRNDR
jgi:hypothetical protein